MSISEKLILRLLSLSDADLLELEQEIATIKATRNELSGGVRFPELRCSPTLDEPDIRRPETAPGTAAHRDMVATAMQLASVAGKAAYERGLPKIPSQDPAFMEFLRAHSSGPRVRFIQAWNEAWSTAWYAAKEDAALESMPTAQGPVEMNPYRCHPGTEDSVLGKILSEKPMQAASVFADKPSTKAPQ